jgi:hypothetical protein
VSKIVAAEPKEPTLGEGPPPGGVGAGSCGSPPPGGGGRPLSAPPSRGGRTPRRALFPLPASAEAPAPASPHAESKAPVPALPDPEGGCDDPILCDVGELPGSPAKGGEAARLPGDDDAGEGFAPLRTPASEDRPGTWWAVDFGLDGPDGPVGGPPPVG